MEEEKAYHKKLREEIEKISARHHAKSKLKSACKQPESEPVRNIKTTTYGKFGTFEAYEAYVMDRVRLAAEAQNAEEQKVANNDTLWRELQKLLNEIFHDGGGKDCCETEVVKGIDEAIRILNCLRKVKSKKPESDIAPVKVPEEFICTLSKTIMIEPVVITSGQTYEKRNIIEWLKHDCLCPKIEEVLSDSFWIPNHLINELITQWCHINNVVRQKPSDETVTQLFTRDLEALLQRISSSSSVADQTKAAKELRFLTKKYANVRFFFVFGISDSITRLLTLCTSDKELDLNPELQEHLVTASTANFLTSN